MNPIVLIEAPFDTHSGYGRRSKDFIKSLMKTYPNFRYLLSPIKWGSTPIGLLNKEEDKEIFDNLFNINQLKVKPNIHIQITIANECRPLGEYNILITAGIETDLVSTEWINGANKMDLILVSSKHGKHSFVNTQYNKFDNNRNLIETLKLTTPIDVLFEGYDENVYKPVKTQSDRINKLFDKVETDFNYLFVGTMLPGVVGEDRKNIYKLIETFLKTFKSSTENELPGLILKTNIKNNSEIDFYQLNNTLNEFIKDVKQDGLFYPSIYLLHDDLSDSEMNELYDHPKVKCYISFAKGEGFNRPTLEFSTTKKPIIISNYGGHLDYLESTQCVLLHGKLTPIHSSVVWKGVLEPSSKWFTVDYDLASVKIKDVFENYKSYENKFKRTMKPEYFTMDKMCKKIEELFTKYLPKEFLAKRVDLIL